VVANLTAPVLLALAERLSEGGRPERLVCSGLLIGEADRVSAAFAARGMVERRRLEAGEWSALLIGAG
jgi:ribosomal protein L11 methylase PrmA